MWLLFVPVPRPKSFADHCRADIVCTLSVNPEHFVRALLMTYIEKHIPKKTEYRILDFKTFVYFFFILWNMQILITQVVFFCVYLFSRTAIQGSNTISMNCVIENMDHKMILTKSSVTITFKHQFPCLHSYICTIHYCIIVYDFFHKDYIDQLAVTSVLRWY